MTIDILAGSRRAFGSLISRPPVLWTVALVAGCAGAQPRAAPGDPDPASGLAPVVQLRPPAVVARDFSWRQRVSVQYGDRSPRSFDAVLQKKGDRLSLVGLTPLNTVTFLVEQRGQDVRFDNRTGQALPFDGRHILQDVQRVFFPWLTGPVADGHRAGAVLDEQVSERWERGRLVERTFAQTGRPSVRVTFSGAVSGPSEHAPPARAVLENQRYGYRLVIETAPQESVVQP